MSMAHWSAVPHSKVAASRISCATQFDQFDFMAWIIGLLTVILVLDCLFLMLLVMVQLPKKEAGLGQAFGGGATDALFGAGSGNALTKMTKYATIIFFALTLGVTILNAHQARNKRSNLERTLQSVK